jgi:hypothetical protein
MFTAVFAPPAELAIREQHRVPRILKSQLVHLVAADPQSVLRGNCPVVKTLRGRARRVLANVLVRRTLFNATLMKLGLAPMQRKLLVTRQL